MIFDTMPVLAQLMAQGASEGADPTTLRAIAEESGEHAASRALARLGLEDAAAAKDLADVRALLGAWRDAKRSAWKAVLGWIMRLALALVLTEVAAKFGLWAWVK